MNLAKYLFIHVILFRFDDVFKNDSVIMNERKRYLDHFESRRIQSESADSWHNISAPGLSEFKDFPGDQRAHWKERGYSMILDVLMVDIFYAHV